MSQNPRFLCLSNDARRGMLVCFLLVKRIVSWQKVGGENLGRFDWPELLLNQWAGQETLVAGLQLMSM